MDILQLDDYSIGTIHYLIDNEVEENIHLDYKAGQALQSNNKGKNDITKDVSSFANSDGGIIIYGVAERDHKPFSIEPVDGSEFTKERLEQIIANIQPRIQGIKIYPVRMNGNLETSIYVVKIPRSNDTPHMASDNRYYKRFNFQSVPMESYEVRDLFLRTDSPELDIDKCFCFCANEDEVIDDKDNYLYKFCIGIKNISRKICHLYKFALIFSVKEYGSDFTFSSSADNVNSFSQTILSDGKVKFSFGIKEPIFPEESIDFFPTFEIPRLKVNKFLECSNFEIHLRYDGGMKKYAYNLLNEDFHSLELD